MAKRKTSSFLPKAYQTERNKKFLSATLDQLMNSSNLLKVDGFIGRRHAPSFKSKDNYLPSTGYRKSYNLEPAIVTKKDSTIDSNSTVQGLIGYDDLLHKLADDGVDITDHDKLFSQEFYNWAGFVNFDPLINYGSYYWLKDGPASVSISGGEVKQSGTYNFVYDADKEEYNITELEGRNPTLYLARGGNYTFDTNHLDEFYIQTEPGDISGQQRITTSKSSREIYGVTNNGGRGNLGADIPSEGVTFTVPPLDAQAFYENNLKLLPDVNLVTKIPYKDVQGRRLEDLIEQHNGIDDQRVLIGKTVIFLQDSNDVIDNDNWTFKADYSKHPFDRLGFAQEDGTVKQEDRIGIWKISEVDGILVLNKISAVTYDDRVNVVEGSTYAGRTFYRAQETSYVTIVPVLTANKDTLYYQHGDNKKGYGVIKIVDADAETIEPEDFLGKSQYTSPNGVVFTNGLKITFDSTINSTVYKNNTFYVEGVGSKIHLVDVTLTTPEVDLDTKDYITITRGSNDYNAWSRSNRWFHKDVISDTAKYNKTTIVVDELNRATRPIIQFDSGIELYNHGVKGITGVDLVDEIEKDALTTINGSYGYFVDKTNLSVGTKVVFTKDADLQTRKTIWEVSYEDIDADSTADTLVLKDSGTVISTNDSIYISKGDSGKGKSFWWNGTEWILAQKKTTVNQSPNYKLFDSEGISFNTEATYPSSDFLGNELFKYSVGSGRDDTILGFPLKYRTFNNVGDIQFDNTYGNGTFNYKQESGVGSQATATGFVKIHDPYDQTVSYSNGWTKSISKSRQFQQVEYTVKDTKIKSYNIGAPVEASTNALPNVFVYINNKRTTNFSIEVIEGLDVCKINDTLAVSDSIVIKFISKTVSKKAFYTIPKNLESNGYNDKFTDITLGQLQNHISALVETNKYFTGSLQGSNNLRDLEDYKKTEGLILQHSSPLILPMLLNQYGELNFVEALRHSNIEYEKFKSKFVSALETMDGLDLTEVEDTVDKIMVNLNSNKSSTFPFYTSDMVPYGADATETSYTITDDRDKTYEIISVHNNSVSSNRAVLVYLNNVQLYHGSEYTFETDSSNVRISKAIAIGDTLKIVDYSNTLGNYVPATPTKLGLYPKYKPEIVSDDTYAVTQNVIVGHDGSRTIAYGDTRDAIILELEKRIYNNCKTAYEENVFDIKTHLPSRWRTTNFSVAEVNQVLEDEFLRWCTRHRIPYTENTTFNANNSFTWNYKNFVDKIEGNLLPQGGWKGLYLHYYETYSPHTRAWEMFGWTEKPSWWEDRYGVAPYTSGNKVLWDDVENGHRYTSTTEYTVDEKYARADIYSMMPVTEHGEIKSPIDVITKNSEDLSPSHSWKFGDGSPAEMAWRNSSSYSFSLQHLFSLIRPSEYFSQLFNKSQMVRNKLIDQIVMLSTNQRQQPKDLKVDIPTDRHEGCGNFVAEYLRWQNINVTTNLQNVLKTLDIKLVHKIQGYTDKKLIKVLAEQVSPTSTSNSVYIPDEDYSIHLHKTGPIKSLPYSGVIVQLNTSGFTVYGYDLNNPKFKTYVPIKNGNFKIHDVGQDRVTEYEEYDDTKVVEIPYGHTFTNKQDVADFFFAYQRWLTKQGYDFDNRMEDFGSQKIVANWLMSVKEFLHWSRQGWLQGSVITISPSANRIRCLTNVGIADALSNSQARTNVLNQNYEPMRPGTYKMSRQDGEFELYPNSDNGGIYFVNTKLVEYEHALVFNNITRFNDIIYQPSLGNRQFRIRLVGFKTGGWDGSLTAQGFIYNDGDVPGWLANNDYVRGDIVTYKGSYYTSVSNHTSGNLFVYEHWTQTDSFKIGLLPNFDTLGKNFESFYDVNAVNLESETDKYGKGSIGYQNRSYFNKIGLDDVSQVKFYQGMLQEKGTKNAVDKLVRSKFDQISSDISFYEEWAIRQAEYGAVDVNARVEIKLDEEGFKDNPQVIKTVNSTQDKTSIESKTEFTTDELFKAPSDVTYDWVPTRKSFVLGHNEKTFYDNLYPNAGYPKLIDADATLFYGSDAATLSPMVKDMKVGYTLWVAEDLDDEWDMKYLDSTGERVINCDGGQDGSTYTWTTSDTHSLSVGDIVAIKNYSTKRDGVYVVKTVPNVNSFTTDGTKEVATEAGDASILKFISIRYRNTEDVSKPKLGWQLNDKFYVDEDEDKRWYVVKRNTSYDQQQALAPLAPVQGERFGDAMCSEYNGQWLVVGQPELNKFHVYTPQPKDLVQFGVIQSSATNISELGKSVSTGIYEPRTTGQLKYEEWSDTTRWVAVGAPNTNSGKGAVLFYYRDTKGGSFLAGTLDQPTGLTSSAKFGTKVKMSANGQWCIVSAPGDKKVFVYHRAQGTNAESLQQEFIGDGSTTSFILDASYRHLNKAEELYVRIQGVDMIANRDYSYNGTSRTITFTVAPAVGKSISVSDVHGWVMNHSITGTIAGFGNSLDIDACGKYIVIGNPNESVVGADSVTRMGSVEVYARHYEAFTGDGTTKDFQVTTSDIGMVNNNVYQNGVLVGRENDDSTINYAKVDGTSTISFTTAPAKGDEITVWTENFLPLHSLAPNWPQAEGNFGSSAVRIDEEAGSIFVGVPEKEGLNENSGIIEIFERTEKWENNVNYLTRTIGSYTTGQSMYINGYRVTATGTDLDEIIKDINDKNIPGITATGSNGVLTITSSNPRKGSIHITGDQTGSLHKDLNLHAFAGSKKIELNKDASNFKFGEVIEISREGKQVVVGCPTGSTTVRTNFDAKKTELDGNATRFTSEKTFTGSVHIFQKLASGYVEADSLYTSSLDVNDQFGYSIAISKDSVFVGSPSDDHSFGTTDTGRVIHYNKTGELFAIDEKEETLVDVDRINKVFLYNNATNKILTYLDYIDPLKGKIIGEAEQEIDFKTSFDPAIYNYTDGTQSVNDGSNYWQPTRVGQIWWDLSKVKFIQYEQGNDDYKSTFWGGVFPGSTIQICQWVESSVKPSSYTGGTAKYGDSAYVEITSINDVTKQLQTKYYFWATSIVEAHPSKNLSVGEIYNLIVDPITNKKSFAMFTGKNSIALANCDQYLEADNVVLAVDYDRKPNDKSLHTEWSLVQENNPKSAIPSELFEKIKDSLAGADSEGNKVPDIKLSAGDRYGIKIRPRQSVFMNRYLAMKEYTSYVNNVIKKYNITDNLDFTLLNSEEPLPKSTSGLYDEKVLTFTELGYVREALHDPGYRVLVETDSEINGRWSIHTLQGDRTWLRTRSQSYDTKKFWKLIDWYDTGYSVDTNIDYRFDNFNDVYKTEMIDGSIIKITTGTQWSLYCKKNTQYDLIGQKGGTIEFNTSVFDYITSNLGYDADGYDFNLLDLEPQIETRKIVETVKDQILVGPLEDEHNKLMFVLLRFALQEQPYVDWIFKTSFVNVKHKLRALDQFPTYQRDNQEFVKEYINEVKPYHSNVREYVLGYNKLETYEGDTTDFDLPSSYDKVTKTFRSPNKEQSHDITNINNSNQYKMWKENHSYYIDDLTVSKWGFGYQTAPTITIEAPKNPDGTLVTGGITATATCDIIDNHINEVTMTNKGSGYLKAPTITVEGGSPTLDGILHAQMKNEQTRKIKETIKFDRIRYSSSVKEWKASTEYTTADIIQHNGEAYTVNEAFTSGTTFDSTKLTVKEDATFNNAMDRTMAYYIPKAGQDGKDLGQIFKGITYPGTKVEGPLFTANPGMDKGGFDSQEFDNFEVDKDGRFVLSNKNIDLDMQSKFDDTQLGLRPEDIIVDGSSKFVDAYSSHAPEEFVPGRVFDTLNINVFTAPSRDADGDGALGMPISVINYKGDGSNKVFKFGNVSTTGLNPDIFHSSVQELFVYSKTSGRIPASNYTVLWADSVIRFNTAPANNEIISITAFGVTGDKLLLDFEFRASGGETEVVLPVSYSLVENKQTFILANGVHATAGTLTSSDGGTTTTWTPAVSSLGTDDLIHFHAFDVPASSTRTFSKVTVDEFTVNDSTRTFTLTEGSDTDLARVDKIIVELNGQRLRPPVFTYLTNDSSTATYDLTTTADIDHSNLVKANTRVYINGVQTTNYSIVEGSDSTIKAVKLDEAPPANSKIDVADVTNAEYILSSATSLTITGGTWTGNDSVCVTTFNNHDNLKMTTETFKGGSSNAITTNIGFDVRGYETVSFDAVTASVVNIAEFNVFTTPTDVSYLWVTKNGVKMLPNQDYKLEGGKLVFADTLNASDITIITQFTEEIIKPALGFRIFKDLFDKNYYYRLAEDHTTELGAELKSTDSEITVSDPDRLPVPDIDKAIPGVVYINGERIEYLELDLTTKKLSRLRRGTRGTGVLATHSKGSKVVDMSGRQEIPSAHDKTWYKVSGGNPSDGLGLQNSNTLQAKFLIEKPTYIKS